MESELTGYIKKLSNELIIKLCFNTTGITDGNSLQRFEYF